MISSCFFIFFLVCLFCVRLQDMSTSYMGHGLSRKRSKEEAAAAIESIGHRKIVIERGVLRYDIRVPPFDFI
jgi:hypothetical protein